LEKLPNREKQQNSWDCSPDPWATGTDTDTQPSPNWEQISQYLSQAGLCHSITVVNGRAARHRGKTLFTHWLDTNPAGSWARTAASFPVAHPKLLACQEQNPFQIVSKTAPVSPPCQAQLHRKV